MNLYETNVTKIFNFSAQEKKNQNQNDIDKPLKFIIVIKHLSWYSKVRKSYRVCKGEDTVSQVYGLHLVELKK